MQSQPWFASEGNELLWQLQTQSKQPPLMVRTLWRWLHIQPSPDLTASLQVSHLNGHGLHEIGEWLISSSSSNINFDNENGEQPHDFRWLPSGRRISFVSHRALYTVPAD